MATQSEPKPRLEPETTWLREYARTYGPHETAFEFSPGALRAAGVTILDIRHGFRDGFVVFSDKLDEPGAIWVVESETCDGLPMRAEITVITETYSVKLRSVHVVRERQNVNDTAA